MLNSDPCKRRGRSIPVLLVALFLAAASTFGQSRLEEDDYGYAKRLYNDRLYDLAAEQFLRYVERYSTSPYAPECLYLAGESFRQAGKPGRARSVFSRLLVEYPNSAFTDDALFSLSAIFESAGDYAAAAETLERVPVLAPNSPRSAEAYLRAGVLYRRAGDYHRSAIALQRCLGDPKGQNLWDAARVELARTRMAQGRPQMAVAILQEFVNRQRMDSVTAAGLLELARIHEQLLELRDADALYRRVQSGSAVPELRARAALGGVRVALLRGDLVASEGLCRQMLTTSGLSDSLRWRARILLAVALSKQGRGDEALQQLEGELFGLAPELQRSVLLARTILAMDERKPALAAQSAEALYRSCQEDSVHRVMAWWALARWLEAGGGNEAAREALEIARSWPAADSAFAFTVLAAEALARQPAGSVRAKALLSDFLLRQFSSPHVDRASYALANILLREGRTADAIRELTFLLRQFPESDYESSARSLLDSLHLFAPLTTPDAMVFSLKALAETGGGQATPRGYLTAAEVALGSAKDYETAARLAKLAVARGAQGKTLYLALRTLAEAMLGRSRAEKGLRSEDTGAAFADSAKLVLNLMAEKFPYDFGCRERELLASAVLLGSGDAFAKLDELTRVTGASGDSAGTSACPQAEWVQARALWQLSGYGEHDSLAREAEAVARRVAATAEDSLACEALALAFEAAASRKDTAGATELARYFLNRYDSGSPRWASVCLGYARMLQFQGRFREAADLYREVIQKRYYSSVAAEARRRLAECLVRQGQYEEALRVLRAGTEWRLALWEPGLWLLLPQGGLDCSAALTEAQALAGLGRKQEAIAVLARARLEVAGNGAGCLAQIAAREAKLLSQIGNWEAASFVYENLWTNGELPLEIRSEAALDWLNLLLEHGQYGRAAEVGLELWDRAADKEVSQKAAELAVVALYRAGNLQKARALVSRFEREFGKGSSTTHARARFAYEEGEYFYREKRFDRALKAYDRAASDFKRTEWGQRAEFAIARTHLTLNHTDKALEILTNLPQKYPDTEVARLAYLNLGVFYRQNKQLGNAIFALTQVVEDSQRAEPSTLQSAERELIRCLDEAGMWDRALVILRDYLRRFPDAEDVFGRKIQIGTLLIRLNEYDRAIEHLRKLLTIADSETRAEIQYWIGKAYLNKGDLEMGIAEMLKVKYVCPPTKLPWDVTALFEAGVAYMRLGELDRAESLFQQIVRERGSASNFGRSALQKIQEIRRLRQEGGKKSS